MAERDKNAGTVFLLEDEPLIMLELQQLLSELGWTVVHTASDVAGAMEVAKTADFDVGILDVNVRGQTSQPVAEILRRSDVPVIVATGYGIETVLDNYPGATFLRKPYVRTELARALLQVSSRKEKAF